MATAAALLLFDAVGMRLDGGQELLADVSAEVPAGSITVVAGPSGAGKSTLLRLGDRLEAPTSGRVLFEGVDTATMDPCVLRRRVGMVFQHPVLFAGTVADNLRVAEATASDGQLIAALDQVGLASEFLERTADDLSGGEGQRVCIARTLLTDPRVLLMDEPTSALDPTSRRAIEDLTRTLAERGLAIMWVSHDHDQVERLADHLVVLRNGRRVPEDEAREYLRDDAAGEDR
jgi:putative ABC transport system ATP-binding protein